MRIIDVARSLLHEEEIEGTIDCQGEYESCGEYAKYRDRDVGEELAEYPWESHHRDEYDDRRHHT